MPLSFRELMKDVKIDLPPLFPAGPSQLPVLDKFSPNTSAMTATIDNPSPLVDFTITKKMLYDAPRIDDIIKAALVRGDLHIDFGTQDYVAYYKDRAMTMSKQMFYQQMYGGFVAKGGTAYRMYNPATHERKTVIGLNMYDYERIGWLLEATLDADLVCDVCQGQGTLTNAEHPYTSYAVEKEPCWHCDGSGIDPSKDTEGIAHE